MRKFENLHFSFYVSLKLYERLTLLFKILFPSSIQQYLIYIAFLLNRVLLYHIFGHKQGNIWLTTNDELCNYYVIIKCYMQSIYLF
jgi:hypothetical protein